MILYTAIIYIYIYKRVFMDLIFNLYFFKSTGKEIRNFFVLCSLFFSSELSSGGARTSSVKYSSKTYGT